MLKMFYSPKGLDIQRLMGLYGDPNDIQDFYSALIEFYRQPHAFYALWLEKDRYISALRIEPYKDGWLVAGLQTVQNERNMGHAKSLLSAVLSQMPKGSKLYSHIDKRNMPSLAVHADCGFTKLLDHAVYLDGSVFTSSYTYCKEIPAP